MDGRDTTQKSSASSTMWGEDPCGCVVPASCDSGSEPLSSPWRAKSRCTAREQKRKLQNWRLDGRRYRGTEVAEVARSVVRQEWGSRMTSKPDKMPTPVADRPVRQRPVRVKLTRRMPLWRRHIRLTARLRIGGVGMRRLARCRATSSTRRCSNFRLQLVHLSARYPKQP